jgi:hypothetical protein
VIATVPLAVWLVVGWPLYGWGSLAAAIVTGLGPYAVAVLAVEGRLRPRWHIRLPRLAPRGS